ncbi:MAG: prepilin peptidase [Myxococcaceae bacterium]|nr:prepilin peptidase [Myxococcaceae bacterium]
MPESLLVVFLFVLGLLFGSFLNVVIHRLPRAESETSTWWVGYSSLVNPRRSQCPHCQHAIRWYENVPLVSWLALRGKCSACKAPISPRYVLVELMTGLLFVACFVRFGVTYPLLPALVMMVLVVPLVFIDAEHWILPFELTLPGITLGLALSVPLGWDVTRSALLGAAGGFLTFRAMEFFGWLLFRKEALGAGDKYLLALLGAFLGWRPLFAVLFLSSIQGAVVGAVSLALRGRAGPQAPVAEDTPAPAVAAPPEPQAEELEEVFTFTPDVLKPGVPLLRRVLLLPWTLLFQPIPDDPPTPEGADGQEEDVEEWTPGVTSLPFGPWIGLAGIEVLLLTPWLHATFAGTPFSTTLSLLFGQPQ